MTPKTDDCREAFEQKYPYAAFRDGEGYQDIRINGHVVKYLWEGWEAAWSEAIRKDDAMPCVCCGSPSDTATADDAEMCYPCAVSFQATEYSNLKERFTDLLKRDYPNADIEDAIDDLRPLPEQAAWNAATVQPTEGQRQDALDSWSYIHLFCGVHAKNERDRQALNDRFVTIHRALQSPAVPREVVDILQDFYDNGYDRGNCEKALALLGGKEG
jgi:hypothetical protein